MLRTYQCIKTVQAFEIGKIEGTVLFDKATGDAHSVDSDYIIRHPLNQPGYYVLYEDGYESFSPKAAFENGYFLLEGMPLEGALNALRRGETVSRPTWTKNRRIVQIGDKMVIIDEDENVNPLVLFHEDILGTDWYVIPTTLAGE